MVSPLVQAALLGRCHQAENTLEALEEKLSEEAGFPVQIKELVLLSSIAHLMQLLAS